MLRQKINVLQMKIESAVKKLSYPFVETMDTSINEFLKSSAGFGLHKIHVIIIITITVNLY